MKLLIFVVLSVAAVAAWLYRRAKCGECCGCGPERKGPHPH